MEEVKVEKKEWEKGDLFYDAEGEVAPELPDVCKLMGNDNWAMAGNEDMAMDDFPMEEEEGVEEPEVK